jgi:hypothetical protein
MVVVVVLVVLVVLVVVTMVLVVHTCTYRAMAFGACCKPHR